MKVYVNGIAKFCFLLTLLVLAGCPSPVKQEPVKPAIVTITYDNNGHGTLPEKKFVFLGLKLSENDLPELTETDWFFCGWEIDGRKAIVGEPVNKDITLKAIWKNDIPEFSITSGEIDYQTEVELSYFRQDAVIYYTVNGSEPTEGSLIYREPIEITADMTVKAIAVKDGRQSQIATAEYKIKLYDVTFSTNGHGLAPEPMKKHKWEQIDLPQVIPEATLQFDCWSNGIDNYNVGELYTVTRDVSFTAVWIGLNDVKAPKFRPEGDSVDYNEFITITSETEGAEIYYSTDGTEPSAKSQKYSGPFMLKTDTVIKAIAVKSGMNTSLISTKTYKIKKYSVNFNVNGHGVQPEKITDKVKGDVIKLPGLVIPVADSSWIFDKWNDGTNDYDAGAEYTIIGNVTFTVKWVELKKVAAPAFSVAAGVVNRGTKVSVSCATEGAVIYYTTDGTVPDSTSQKYKSGIEITSGVTIKAIAVKNGMKDSDVTEIKYTVDVTPPVDVTNLTANCTASQTVKLTWLNPTDTDFAKVMIIYGTDGKVEVLKDTTPNNEATVTGLTNGTSYTFTVKTYDKAGNASSGRSIKATPCIPSPVESTKAGIRPQNVQGPQALPIFKADITDHLYLAESSANATGYIASWDINNAATYQWYTGTTGNWHKISSGESPFNLQITVTTGTTYYMLEAKSADGQSIAYSNVCTVVCGGDKTKDIGKIVYSDGLYDFNYVSGKTPVGIIFDVNADGSPKTIVNLVQDSKEWCSESSQGYSRNFVTGVTTPTSYTDGSGNWNIICDNVTDEGTAGNYPAFEYCNGLTDGGKTWYLPARDELMALYFNKTAVNAAVKTLTDNSVTAIKLPESSFYYSSSQYVHKDGSKDYFVWGVYFDSGWQTERPKEYMSVVRGVARLN